jgi:hypothetical protein
MDLTLDYRTLPSGLHRRLCYSYNLTRPRLIESDMTLNLSYEFLSMLEPVNIGISIIDLILNTKVKINRNLNNFCTICQNDIREFSIIRELKCECIYHNSCIEKWTTNSNRCPNCRQSILV